MTPAVLEQIGNWILLACAPAIWLFTGLYWWRSNWRANMAGRALFHMALAMSIVMLLALVTATTGYNWPFRLWLRIFVFGYLTFTFWRLLITLIRVLRRYNTID